MSYFAVIREAGPRWEPGKGSREQQEWDKHAAFMDALTDDGFVIFGGPLAGSYEGPVRALHIVKAASETEIHRRFDDDPWTPMGLLTTQIDSWDLWLGPERMAAAVGSAAR